MLDGHLYSISDPRYILDFFFLILLFGLPEDYFLTKVRFDSFPNDFQIEIGIISFSILKIYETSYLARYFYYS